MTERRSFIATLWMSILVALLSALAPLGPPASRLTGSAFNPATITVVLKARSPVAEEKGFFVETGRERSAYLAAPVLSWLLLAGLAIIVARLCLLARCWFLTLADRRTSAHPFHRRARAPPALF